MKSTIDSDFYLCVLSQNNRRTLGEDYFFLCRDGCWGSRLEAARLYATPDVAALAGADAMATLKHTELFRNITVVRATIEQWGRVTAEMRRQDASSAAPTVVAAPQPSSAWPAMETVRVPLTHYENVVLVDATVSLTDGDPCVALCLDPDRAKLEISLTPGEADALAAALTRAAEVTRAKMAYQGTRPAE